MNEHSFVDSVHRHLKGISEHTYGWKIHDNYAGGIPDAWYCGNDGDVWVEYKFIAAPKRDTTLIKPTHTSLLSKLQQDWLEKRYYQNIITGVIIGANEGILILEGLDWQQPVPASHLKNGLTPKDVAKWILSKTG